MARLIRVDAELVRRGLASSRRHAQELVESGLVRLSGETVRKSARQMDPAQPLLVVEGERDEYVSRGARKLAGALDALGEAAPAVAGRRCLDAGASTGGFTDVLLRRGAGHVVAVDVGYGQIAWRLREDPRVTVLERTNVRTLDPAAVAPAPGLVVGTSRSSRSPSSSPLSYGLRRPRPTSSSWSSRSSRWAGSAWGPGESSGTRGCMRRRSWQSPRARAPTGSTCSRRSPPRYPARPGM